MTDPTPTVPGPGADLILPFQPAPESGAPSNITRLFMVSVPTFSPAEAARLDGLRPDVVIELTDNRGGKWRPLSCWLAPVDRAIVRCSKSQLCIRWPAVDKELQLLRFANLEGDRTLRATLRVQDEVGADRSTELDVIQLEETGGYLQLARVFDPKQDGQQLYEVVVAAMDRLGSGIRIELEYSHQLMVASDPNADAGQVPRVSRAYLGNRVIKATAVELMPMRFLSSEPAEPVIAQSMLSAVVLESAPTRFVAKAQAPAAVAAAPLMVSLRMRQTEGIPIFNPDRVPQNRVPPVLVQPPPPPPAPPPPIFEQRAIPGHLPLPLELPQTSHKEVFPDRPPPGEGSWLRLEVGNRTLAFRRFDEPDVFYYVPTCYRPSFRIQPGGPRLAPVAPTHYRDPQSDEDRVKVRVRAVPHIDAADKEALRQHIELRTLGGTMPFVSLRPISGMPSSFSSFFTSGPDVLPETITFKDETTSTAEEIVLTFDMHADHYEIFSAMLERGLQGKLTFHGSDLQTAVDVSFGVEDLTAGSIVLQVSRGSSGALALQARNLLTDAVQIESLSAFFVDRGRGIVPGLVFDAEAREVLAGPRRLGAAGAGDDVCSVDIEPHRPGVQWDDVALSLGKTTVVGVTAKEWLDRIHSDPSLSPAPLVVTANVLFPADARIDYVQLRQLHGGKVESEMQVRRSDPPVKISLQTSLAELAGRSSSGDGSGSVLEFYSVYADIGPGLPQRMALSRNQRSLVVQALLETAESRYTIEHGAANQREVGKTVAEAQVLLEQCKASGELWRLFALRPN